jgi:hypothetical protein
MTRIRLGVEMGIWWMDFPSLMGAFLDKNKIILWT